MKMMDAQLEQEASVAGLRERTLRRQREKLWQAFRGLHDESGGGPVLEVASHGGQPAPGRDGSGLELTRCFLEPTLAAGSRYTRNDGRHLLYADGEFDWVFCDGLLEQARGFDHQFHLLAEMSRVARKGVFATAANRRYPLDFATGMPLAHWLPGPVWRRLLGQRRYLLTAPDLKRMASLLAGRPWFDVGHIRLGGPKAHLFLMVKKG